MSKISADKNKSWFLGLVSVVIAVVLGIEFIVTIPHDPVFTPIVYILDLLLIAGYLLFIVWGAFQNRGAIISWIKHEKIDLILLSLVLITAYMPRLSAAIVIGRAFLAFCMHLLGTKLGKRISSHLNLRPSQTLALSFIGVILLGTILLTFPAATSDGHGAPFLDALFVMTSAACVSGLLLHDIGSYYTVYGQAVIMMAIQMGGLGIMVLSVAFTAMVGGRIPSRIQAGIGEMLDITSADGLKSLMRAVIATTLFFEFLGAIALFFIAPLSFESFADRLWWSVFHAISAFCNAGITLTPNSLVDWVSYPLFCGVFMVLITAGGIGFFVIADLTDKHTWVVKRPQAVWKRLHLQTKVVLIATFLLDFIGMLAFLYLEFDGALSELDIFSQLNAALFQSVSLRTAGFSTVAMSQIAVPTILFCIVWMFIGASPGSTGGGIKTTTAAVAIMGVKAMLKGRADVETLSRRIPYIIVSRSLSMVLISGVIIIIFLMLLSGTQDLPFEKILFEVFSAFGTVGFTMDLTQQFDAVGRILLILLMYVGRIGPLTLALAIGEQRASQRYRYPVGQLAVG